MAPPLPFLPNPPSAWTPAGRHDWGYGIAILSCFTYHMHYIVLYHIVLYIILYYHVIMYLCRLQINHVHECDHLRNLAQQSNIVNYRTCKTNATSHTISHTSVAWTWTCCPRPSTQASHWLLVVDVSLTRPVRFHHRMEKKKQIL